MKWRWWTAPPSRGLLGLLSLLALSVTQLAADGQSRTNTIPIIIVAKNRQLDLLLTVPPQADYDEPAD
jgi:hypothetical protein